MDTYAEFQACLLEHQGWSMSAEWITTSAPHRGADFSGGAGGSVLRARFGYEPRRSRSWRLISQYSVTSRSQAEMFARVRRATDAGEDEYGLLDDCMQLLEGAQRLLVTLPLPVGDVSHRL